MVETRARSRLLALAVAAAFPAVLGGCRGDEVPPAGDADAPSSRSEAASLAGESADMDASTIAGGPPRGDQGDTASAHLPAREVDSSSIVRPSAIALLLDSLLAEGVEDQRLAARAGDSAYVARFAGDSLLAESFSARPRLPPGTRFRVTSDWLVTAADNRPGDPVVATLADDVAGPHGRVLVARGAKLLGTVTEAQDALGPGEVPFLEVAFETLSTETWERPIRTRVVAVLPPEPPLGEGVAGQADPTLDTAVDPNLVPDQESLVGPDAIANPDAGLPSATNPGEILDGAVLVVELEEQLVLPTLLPAPEVADTLAPETADTVSTGDPAAAADTLATGDADATVATLAREAADTLATGTAVDMGSRQHTGHGTRMSTVLDTLPSKLAKTLSVGGAS